LSSAKQTTGKVKTWKESAKGVYPWGELKSVIGSARIRVSLITAKDSREQKSCSSEKDSSIHPQKTGITKKHGTTHRIKNNVMTFMLVL